MRGIKLELMILPGGHTPSRQTGMHTNGPPFLWAREDDGEWWLVGKASYGHMGDILAAIALLRETLEKSRQESEVFDSE